MNSNQDTFFRQRHLMCVSGSYFVQVNSPYLEEHLMHMIKQDQSKVHNMDLLWRYYEKNRNFGKAAHVLARLADMHRSVNLFIDDEE